MSTTVRFSIGQLLGMDDTIGDLLAGDLQAQFAVAYDGSDWTTVRKNSKHLLTPKLDV